MPARPPATCRIGDRHARVEEQRAARAGTRLRELLRREDAEREAAIDELVRQGVRLAYASLDEVLESDLARMCDALLDRAERTAVEKIGRVHPVIRLT